MTVYTLPFKQSMIDWLGNFPSSAQYDLLRARILSGLAAGGYVVGPAGVSFTPAPGPMVRVDVDRDPTADWATFDPTKLGSSELAAVALRKQIRDFKAVMTTHKNTLTTAPVATNGNILAQFEALKKINLDMANGWLALCDLLDSQIMQRDNGS